MASKCPTDWALNDWERVDGVLRKGQLLPTRRPLACCKLPHRTEFPHRTPLGELTALPRPWSWWGRSLVATSWPRNSTPLLAKLALWGSIRQKRQLPQVKSETLAYEWLDVIGGREKVRFKAGFKSSKTVGCIMSVCTKISNSTFCNIVDGADFLSATTCNLLQIMQLVDID